MPDDQAHTNAIQHWAEACLDPSVNLRYDAAGQLHDISATLAVLRSAYEKRTVSLSEIEDLYTAFEQRDGLHREFSDGLGLDI